MPYRRTYINHFVNIKVSTNSKAILRLLDNFLDFDDACRSRPGIKIRFYLDEVKVKKPQGPGAFFYHSFYEDNNLLSSFGQKLLTVTANPKTGVVRGDILDYKESSKERILDSIFSQPLHFILACRGLFFLHASSVCKDKDCILISGPQDSGKSTLALTFAQNGFSLLADDDCFVKLARDRAQLFPFPTKMGLNDKISKKHPELIQHTLKNYRYGKKLRISLNSFANSHNYKELGCKMIIFPKYKSRSKASLKLISKKEALDRLTKDNIFIYPNDKLNQRLSINFFWVRYSLTTTADSFELIYNDANINKIPGIVNKFLDDKTYAIRHRNK